ncbi:MAG TPA: hypothetical protein VIV60_21400 [Polyangiaceae bacterium]
MVASSEAVARLVIQQAASLQHHLERELGKRVLVLPNGKFFPDRFCGDAESVTALIRRMQAHAGMSDVPIETRVLGAHPAINSDAKAKASEHHCKGDCGGKGCEGCDGSCHDRPKHDAAESAAASCSTGCGSGCGVPNVSMGDEPRLVDLGNSWRVQIPDAELKHPLLLTTNLARALGMIFLVETRSPTHPTYPNPDVTAELVGTLLGFGALLLSGAHVYSKSCGGPQIRQLTALGCPELALATVLFANRQQQDLRPMRKELEVTQRAALQEAEDWLKDRPAILKHFATAPERLERGEIPMAPVQQGLFGRIFGTRRRDEADMGDPESQLAELESMLAQSTRAKRASAPTRRDPRADELRALVDEAFESPGSPLP